MTKINYKLPVLIILLFILIINVNGQTSPNIKRVEIEAKAKSDNYNVIPLEEKGVLIFSEGDENAKDQKIKSKIWNFTLYGIDFEQVWTQDVPVVKNSTFQKYELENDILYITLAENSKSSKENIQILKVNINGTFFQEISSITPSSSLNKFAVNNGNIFIGGNTIPSNAQIFTRMMGIYCGCYIPLLFGFQKVPTHPLMYYGNFNDGVLENKHPSKKQFEAVVDISTIESTGHTEVLIRSKPEKKTKTQNLISRVYDSQCEQVDEYKIKSKSGNIISEVSVFSENGKKILVGTYKKVLDKKSKKKYKIYGFKDGDNGMFFINFNEFGKQNKMKDYDFTKINGFDNFVPKSTDKKMKKQKRKKPLIGYKMLVHDPIYNVDEIIVITEAYYEEYHTEYTTDANGRSTAIRVFDGYRTTHSLIAGFDYEGNMKWSTSFGINALSFILKERLRVTKNGNQTILAFSYGGMIYKKKLVGSEVIDVSTIEIETQFGDDKVKDNYESDMQYWYDNYYIAYGYQKIKADKKVRKDGVKRKRNVFYFNKIEVND